MDSAAVPVLGQRGKDQGFGGFPGPFQLSIRLAKTYFPRFHEMLDRIITQPVGGKEHDKKGKSFRWLSDEFSRMIILRNSDFDTDDLDDEQLEQLGGLE